MLGISQIASNNGYVFNNTLCNDWTMYTRNATQRVLIGTGIGREACLTIDTCNVALPNQLVIYNPLPTQSNLTAITMCNDIGTFNIDFKTSIAGDAKSNSVVSMKNNVGDFIIVPKWSCNDTKGIFVMADGKIGIHNKNPVYALDIAGEVRIGGTVMGGSCNVQQAVVTTSILSSNMEAIILSSSNFTSCNITYASNLTGPNASFTSRLISPYAVLDVVNVADNISAYQGRVQILHASNLTVSSNITVSNAITSRHIVASNATMSNLTAVKIVTTSIDVANTLMTSNMSLNGWLLGSNATVSVAGVTMCNGTAREMQMSNLSASNITTCNITITGNLIGPAISLCNVNAQSVTSTSINAWNGTFSSNLTTSNLTYTGVLTGSQFSAATLTGSNISFVNTLVGPNITTSNFSTSNLTIGNNINVVGVNAQNLRSSNAIIPTITASNIFTSNLSFTNNLIGTSLVMSTVSNNQQSSSNIRFASTLRGPAATFCNVATSNLDTNSLNIYGLTQVSGDILPISDAAFNLGNPSTRFHSLYLSGQTLYLGGVAMKSDPVTNHLRIEDEGTSQLSRIAVEEIQIGLSTSNITNVLRTDPTTGQLSFVTAVLSNNQYVEVPTNSSSNSGGQMVSALTACNLVAKTLRVDAVNTRDGIIIQRSDGLSNAFGMLYTDTTQSGFGVYTGRSSQDQNAFSIQTVASSNTSLVFSTSNQERMRILPNGNIGIGTSNPSARLHVQGDGIFSRSLNASNMIAIENRLQSLVDSNAFVVMRASPSENAFISSAQNTRGLVFGTATNQAGTTFAESLRILPNANIGVCKSNPQYTLDINGDLGVSSNIMVLGNTSISGDATASRANFGNGVLNAGLSLQANGNMASIATTSDVGASFVIAAEVSKNDGGGSYYKLGDIAATSRVGSCAMDLVMGSASASNAGRYSVILTQNSATNIASTCSILGHLPQNMDLQLWQNADQSFSIWLLTFGLSSVAVQIITNEVVNVNHNWLASRLESPPPATLVRSLIKTNYTITTFSGNCGLQKEPGPYTIDVNGDINFGGMLYKNGLPYTPSQWSVGVSNDMVCVGPSSNVGVGTFSPQFALDVAGTVNACNLYVNGQPYIGSQWTTTGGSNVWIGLGSNIGIGTNNPEFLLDVNGTINATSIYMNGTPYKGSQWLDVASNVYIIGSNVGIGTADPQAQLHVQGNTIINGNLQFDNSMHIKGLKIKRGFGIEANLTNTASSILGYTVDQSGMLLQINSNVDNKAFRFIADNKECVRIMGGTGNVGIGESNPLYPLHVTGHSNNASIYASHDVVISSDARYKTNIQPIKDALCKVQKITGYTFNKLEDPNGPRLAGVLAQEVQSVLPEVVHVDELGQMSVAYPNMVAILINAIKDMAAKVDDQSIVIGNLQNEIDSLKSQMPSQMPLTG
jgi:hypothetical protein